MLLASNATISTTRASYNAATKQSVFVLHLATVPVYIREIGNDLRIRGFAPEYDARMTFDAIWDIVDGDQISGYDPTGTAPLWQVRHVALKKGTMGSFKVALLRAVRQ